MDEINKKFRLYADSAPFATLIYQTDKWIYANNEAEILTGYSQSELLEMNFWEIVHANFTEIIKERGFARLKGEWPKDRYELQIKRKNGEARWVEIHMNKLILDEKTSVIVGAIDISEKKKNEFELIESKERYKILTDNLIEAVVLLDSNYTIEFANPSIYSALRMTPQELNGKSFTQACFYEHRLKLMNLLQSSKKKGFDKDTFDFSYEDTVLKYELHSKYSFRESKYIIVFHDITHKEAVNEREKRLSMLQNTFIKLVSELVRTGIDQNTYKRILKMAIDIIPGVQAGSALLKDGEKFKFAAAIGYDFSLLKMVQLKRDELLHDKNNNICIIKNLSQENQKHLDEDRSYVLSTAGRTGEILEMLSIPIKIDSEVVAYFNLDNLEQKGLIDDSSLKIARLFSDVITALMQKNAYEKALSKKNLELKKLSNYDPLTCLPNRRFLSENINQLFDKVRDRGEDLYMLYIDLNNFKSINDNYGHEFGDLLLAEFGKRVSDKVRGADILSRIGGDEFLLILTCIQKDRLIKFLERFILDIKDPFFIDEKKFYISASIGISQFPMDGDDFQELLQKSDMAMYKAKKEGLPYFFYKPEDENQNHIFKQL